MTADPELGHYQLILLGLHIVRIAQPALILAIVFIAEAARPLTQLATFVFAPHPDQIRAATTIYGTNINGTGESSIFGRARNAYQAIPTSQSTASPVNDGLPPQPTPVIVPVRSRRRVLTFIILSILALTYFLSGAFIVLRAVIPPQSWIPSHPRWELLDWQALLGLLAWSSVGIAIAYEESTRGRGNYGRGKAAWSSLVGFVGDVILLVLYLKSRKAPLEEIPKGRLWVIGQLLILLVRIVLLYPLLLLALRWDKTTFVRASELAQRLGNTPGELGTAEGHVGTSQDSETSALLDPNRAQSSGASPSQYGSTSSSLLKPTNSNAQNKNGTANSSGTRSPNPNAANASMGLTLAAQPPPPTFAVFFQRVRLLFPYLWPSQSLHLQFLALFCVGLLVAGRFVNLFVPLTLGKIVSDLAAGVAPWWHITAYAALKMLQGNGGLLSVMQALAWLPIEQFSDRSISIMAFDHLLHLSMAFHTRRKMGEILRILDRGAVISSFFQYLIFNVVPIFVDIGVAMIFLGSTFGPAVGVAIFCVMFLYTYVSVALTTWRTGLRREANNKDSISRAIHADVLINYELVKVHSNEPYELDRYRAALLDYQLADYRVTASLNLLNLVQNLIITASTLITCLIVARSVTMGYTKSSDFVVFITYLQQVYVPLGFLGTLHRVLMQNLVDTDKLMNLLEEESDVKDVPGAKDLVVTNGVIEFRNVVFSYDGKVEALKGVDFKVNANESAALVGESGAGKSSIMRLLYRFYDIQQGQIFIDGQDISKVKQASLRRAIGIVPQEPGLFNTSIYQNILYGNINATDAEVEAAARAAQIYDRIMSFPEGWRTVVGERGVKLSGGEKQRVALARTFLKDPKILLLDEATSALDSHTEKQLQLALRTILQGRTSLTIAHRLSTIVNSDQIVVMDNGRVVENGTHVQLNERNGLYKSMWMQQIKTDAEARQAAIQEEQEEQKVNADVATTEIASGKQASQDLQATVQASTEGQAVEPTPDVVSAATEQSTEEAAPHAPAAVSSLSRKDERVAFPSAGQSEVKDASETGPSKDGPSTSPSLLTPNKRTTSLSRRAPSQATTVSQKAEGDATDGNEAQSDKFNSPSGSKDSLRQRITSLIRNRTSGGSSAHDRSTSVSTVSSQSPAASQKQGIASDSKTSTLKRAGTAKQSAPSDTQAAGSAGTNGKPTSSTLSTPGQGNEEAHTRQRSASQASIISLPAEEMPPQPNQGTGSGKKRRNRNKKKGGASQQRS